MLTSVGVGYEKPVLDSELAGIKLFCVISGGMVSVTQRAFAEMAKSFTDAHATIRGVTRACAPVHIINLFSSIFELITVGKNLVEIVKAPSYLKTLPFLELIQSSGHILDYFNAGIWLADQGAAAGSAGLEALKAVSMPLTAAALGLQSIGIGIASWKIYEICRVWNKVEKHLNDQNYDRAINVLTAEPQSDIKKYRDKFFGVFSKAQKQTISQLYHTVKEDTVRRGTLFNSLKDHYFHKTAQGCISLALMVIGIVGVALGSFAAVAVAPIGWGILGAAGVLSLGLMAYSIGQELQFMNSINNQITGEA